MMLFVPDSGKYESYLVQSAVGRLSSSPCFPDKSPTSQRFGVVIGVHAVPAGTFSGLKWPPVAAGPHGSALDRCVGLTWTWNCCPRPFSPERLIRSIVGERAVACENEITPLTPLIENTAVAV